MTMAQARVNDVLIGSSAVQTKPNHLQVVDATGARDAALAVNLKHAIFQEAGTATLTVRIQGSTDGTNWKPLDASAPPYTIQVVASGAGSWAGASKSWTLSIEGWRWLRVQYTLTSTTVESDTLAIVSSEFNVN